MRLSSTGGLLAASTDEGRAGVWRLAEGRWELLRDLIVATREADADGETEKAKGPDGFVEIGMLEIPSIAMDDAGTRIVWSTNGGAILTVRLNQPSQRTMVVVPPGHMPPEDLVVSGNGRVIAAIEAGGSRISVAELDASGGVLLSLIVPPETVRSVALDRDGAHLAAGTKSGKIAQYSKSAEWKLIGKPWSVHSSEVADIIYSADGGQILSFGSGGGGADRTVAFSKASGIPDPRALQSRQVSGSVSAMSEGVTGQLLAVGDHDGQVLTWATPARHYSGRMTAGTSYITALVIDDARHRLLTSSGDGSMLSWSLEPKLWVSMACVKANRGFLREEWRELMPDDPYIASCNAAKATNVRRR
jgi:WD40 repeat protein